ncbi:MAG: PilX N-terminal domain-containing pilus assembly protein [Burkholderiaceae bacterium]
MTRGHPFAISAMPEQQRGASLVVSLLMLVAVLLLGISAAQIALQGEKASRNDRDRQIAFQAAEAALMDAEMDIEGSTSSDSRSSFFSETFSGNAITEDFALGCGAGDSNRYLGLCDPQPVNGKPVWQVIDFADDNATTTKSVPFGKFTGQKMQTGSGTLPSKPPRYIIEYIVFNGEAAEVGESAPKKYYIFRITAMGFGVRETTQSVLQTFYRKIDK